MSSQPLSSWWKRCMERMSAEHCSWVRQGWLGVKVWWMYKKERGRERLVGVPLYGFAPHIQRGMMGGQSETHQRWRLVTVNGILNFFPHLRFAAHSFTGFFRKASDVVICILSIEVCLRATLGTLLFSILY